MNNGTVMLTGVTGQAGSYFSELALSKGHKVIGLRRRHSTNESLWRIKHLLGNSNFVLEPFDLNDTHSLLYLVNKYQPEIFLNFGAQSHVKISFELPHYTGETVYGGTLNCLEALRASSVANTCVFFQASSSEMFGTSYSLNWTELGIHHYNIKTDPLSGSYKETAFQNEKTPFNPQSPYAIAKLAAHNLCGLYRDCYNIKICCGIMFNYESPRRGEEFVTRKITKYLANRAYDFRLHLKTNNLKLGNVESFRDWTFAGDTMEAVYLMVTANNLKDYVIGSGQTHSIKEFAEKARTRITSAIIPSDFYDIDNTLFRPSEVLFLRANSSLIKKELGWKPKVSFVDLVDMMVDFDINRVYKERYFL